MSVSLNAARICLLALVELYIEENIPSDAVFPVLSFLASHVLDHDFTEPSSPQDPRWAKAERNFSLIIDIQDFEKLLIPFPFPLGMPGRNLWSEFLRKLWSINSLDALNDFFDRLSETLALTREERRQEELEGGSGDGDDKLRIAHVSPLGSFIRKARLEHQRLPFHDCAELWKSFARYRQPTIHYLRRRNPVFERLSFDTVLLVGAQEDWDANSVSALTAVAYGDMVTGNETGPRSVSLNDVQSLLEFQIEQMQKFGNRVPLEIRNQFQGLLQDTHLVPSLTHYLSFLEAWRSRDYTTAFDFLHRYFDYTMQYRDRLFYQYALMNFAVLQADFGCHKEAVTAMLETISTARENRDLTCLNFALNWLFHFGQAHPDLVSGLEASSLLGTAKESLAFLKARAKESGMWTLWSSVLLSEAKLGLVNGDSVATSIESIVRSSHLIVEKNLKAVVGSQMALQAALWSRLGLTQLSTQTSEIFLQCHARHAIFDDELRHTCLIALDLSNRGRYDEGLERLERLDNNSLRSWRANQYWCKYRAIIKLRRDLHHNNLAGAEEFLDQLLQSKGEDDLEPEVAFTIDALHIDCLTRRGDLQRAFRKTQDMLCTLRDGNTDTALLVRALLIKVSLLAKCGRPQRAFSIAMRATNLALQARIIPCLWQAVGLLCNILVSFGEFDAACQLLGAVIPRALECELSALAAQLYSVLVDAHMGLAGESTRRAEHLMRALAAVDRAFDHYSAIEDARAQCEMMAKKAMIMKLSGDWTRAADYAAAYVELHKTAKALSSAR